MIGPTSGTSPIAGALALTNFKLTVDGWSGGVIFKWEEAQSDHGFWWELEPQAQVEVLIHLRYVEVEPIHNLQDVRQSSLPLERLPAHSHIFHHLIQATTLRTTAIYLNTLFRFLYLSPFQIITVVRHDIGAEPFAF